MAGMDFIKKDVGAFVFVFLLFILLVASGQVFFWWRGNGDFLVNTNISSVHTNTYKYIQLGGGFKFCCLHPYLGK